MTTKETNPKDSVGIRKAPASTVPAAVVLEVGVALLEGARKYGRHNYRDMGVRASVYYDATMRHLMSWWEGEDTDPDSGLSHITKALASLAVLRDTMINDRWEDDRPPRTKSCWLKDLNQRAAGVVDKYPNPLKTHTQSEKEKAPCTSTTIRTTQESLPSTQESRGQRTLYLDSVRKRVRSPIK